MMDTTAWAQLAGIIIGMGFCLRNDVFGHIIHRYACVHKGRRNFGSFYECESCGDRKVARPYGGPTDREKKWIAHEWHMDWEPWEPGPPPGKDGLRVALDRTRR